MEEKNNLKTEQKMVSIRMPKYLHTELSFRAKKDNRTLSNYLIKSLLESLKYVKPK